MILHDVLRGSLSPRVLDDLYYTIQARKIDRGRNWNRDVTEFVGKYRKVEGIIPHDIGIEDLTAMARLLAKIRIVAKEFLKDTLSRHPLTNTKGSLNIAWEDLSKNEERRIYGALIRLELYCALFADPDGVYGHTGVWFGQTSRDDGDDEYPQSWLIHEMAVFLAKLKEWEVEEIFCIRDFCFRLYDRTFKACKPEDRIAMFLERGNDWRRLKPRFWNYLSLSEILMTCGVELVVEFIAMDTAGIIDSEQRVSLVRRGRGKRSPFYDYLFLNFLLEGYNNELKNQWVEGEAGHQPTSDDNEKSSNAAWQWAARERCSFRHWTARSSFRSWGYTMWDKTRLEGLGVMNFDPSYVQKMYSKFGVKGYQN